ncbi:MAG: RluA family pseudouridine synthase [bacterium]|nr:RluA family pseudouridine synthase [bacterium]
MNKLSDKPDRKLVTLTVPADAVSQRLDSWIAAQPELALSRTKVQRLIEDGEILVNGQREQTKYLIQGGESIAVLIPLPPSTDVVGEKIALDIVYEDEYLAVINKPVGMITHPAAGVYSGTLVNALVHHFKSLPKIQGAERPGIVHRLDKNTSGLLLVAKQEETLLNLQRMLEAREIKRTYLALVCGHMPNPAGKIDLKVGRSQRDRTRMAVTETGREAVTEYQLKERFRSVELHEVRLQTGRTHQIRVHFSHLGHPVMGDPEYGGREKWVRGIFAPERLLARKLLSILDHQALHACQLALKHPQTGEQLLFQAEVPGDYQTVLALLRSQPT